MKQLLFIALLLCIPGFIFANDETKKKKDAKTSDIGIRMERKIALTLESGYNSLAGFGINATYYATPNLAVDLGLGVGLQLFKGGVRGRYLFLNKKFTPYVGLGFMGAPLSVPNVEIDLSNTGELYNIDLKPSYYGQFIGGFEYMSNGGFVIGMNLGYASLLKENYTKSAGSNELSEDVKTTLKVLYGSFLAIGFNMGYSF